MFPVDYFDEQAFLTQSGQLYIEATAMALGKVYSFGPTFRAEKSKTRRHLTEFWMVEPEVAYAELDDLMDLAEDLISFLVKRCLERRRGDLQIIGRDLTKLEKIEAPFPRITYDEAAKMLQDAHAKGALENKFEWGGDLGSPDETYISSQFDQAGDGASISREGEGVLHGARSAASRSGACAWTCWRRKAMARSSADRSVWLRTICWCSGFANTAFPKRLSSGTLTCANSAACRMAASAWELNARWHGSADWSTCGKRFHFRAC